MSANMLAVADPWDSSKPITVFPEPAFPDNISVNEIIQGGHWKVWAGSEIGELAVMNPGDSQVAVEIGGRIYKGKLNSVEVSGIGLSMQICCTRYSDWNVRLSALQKKS